MTPANLDTPPVRLGVLLRGLDFLFGVRWSNHACLNCGAGMRWLSSDNFGP